MFVLIECEWKQGEYCGRSGYIDFGCGTSAQCSRQFDKQSKVHASRC